MAPAPTPTATGTPATSHGLSGGAVAGVVLGTLAGVALVVLAGVGFCGMRRRSPYWDWYYARHMARQQQRLGSGTDLPLEPRRRGRSRHGSDAASLALSLGSRYHEQSLHEQSLHEQKFNQCGLHGPGFTMGNMADMSGYFGGANYRHRTPPPVPPVPGAYRTPPPASGLHYDSSNPWHTAHAYAPRLPIYSSMATAPSQMPSHSPSPQQTHAFAGSPFSDKDYQ